MTRPLDELAFGERYGLLRAMDAGAVPWTAAALERRLRAMGVARYRGADLTREQLLEFAALDQDEAFDAAYEKYMAPHRERFEEAYARQKIKTLAASVLSEHAEVAPLGDGLVVTVEAGEVVIYDERTLQFLRGDELAGIPPGVFFSPDPPAHQPDDQEGDTDA